jgi:hypothetical protein
MYYILLGDGYTVATSFKFFLFFLEGGVLKFIVLISLLMLYTFNPVLSLFYCPFLFVFDGLNSTIFSFSSIPFSCIKSSYAFSHLYFLKWSFIDLFFMRTVGLNLFSPSYNSCYEDDFSSLFYN